MQGYPLWGLVGLLFGTVLGVVGAFGGLAAFIIVLVLGIAGFLIGLVLEGGVHLPQMHPRRQ